MIPVIMMIIGGILILISVFGFLAFLFEPLIKNYRIVIKREDDYTHYTSPRNFAMLQTARKEYCAGLAVMFAVGCVLFFSGAYLLFGERGFGFLFSTQEERVSDVDIAVSDEISDSIDKDGNYVDESGTAYSNYIIVKGIEILFNGETIGGTEDFRSFILGCADLGKIYVADGYAASSTYHEVIDILKENGFDYESE